MRNKVKVNKVKIVKTYDGIKYNLILYPHLHRKIPISQMREFWGKKCHPIQCGCYYFNVSKELYDLL